VVAIVVCIANNMVAMKKADIEQDKRIAQIQSQHAQTVAVITCKLDELDRKQTIHNGVIDRVYKLEQITSIQNEKQIVANHRIDDLQR